ncbi:MAG: hypothetical protein HC910_01345 [Spirulinaceae cyanobacterium SM2_1_0]|nr:hypothetical protein [Spirulinaceae cyanobacterium SM2_1_0]
MSTPDRPYNSRLLTLLNQQAIGWSDRLSRSARQLQVWLLWSAQILAYPIYLLAQTSRSLGRKLGQALGAVPKLPATTAENLPPLPSDAPIQRTLAVIEEPVAVQGIACAIASRDLVVVTAENQSLNCLSQEQQQTLQQALRYELASYYYARQVQQERAQRHQIPSAFTEGDHLLPTWRWFWQAMRWVQGSPVAIAIDLFDEARLYPRWQPALPVDPPAPLPLLPPLPLATTMARLDTILANWEARPQQWGQRWQQLPLVRPTNHKPPSVPSQPALADPPPKSPWLGWEELYGFAEPPLPFVLIAPVRDRQHPFPATPAAETQPISDDPWLIWEDTYDGTVGLRIDTSTPPASPQLALAPVPATTPRSPTLPPTAAMPNPPETPNPDAAPVAKSVPPVKKSAAETPPDAALEHQPSAKSPPTANPPDWIEVEAKTSGYVKHPLERLLGWLDALLYWLEEVAIACWRWLQRH